ncbi:hypothetical protein D3C79_712200 [compost metagenome]
MILHAVAVAEVHHQPLGQADIGQGLTGLVDAGGVVVRPVAATQDHVAIGVAGGAVDGHLAVLVRGIEDVAVAGGAHRIDGDAGVAVGAVLEAHRAGEGGGHLAVHLGFCGACAYGAPGDEVADVLAGHHVEEFGGGGHAHLVDVHQQLAGQLQPLVHVETAVEARIVDEPLPAHYGARLLEVGAHHYAQALFVLLAQGVQALGVFTGGGRVVDGAGADDDQQALILTGQNGFYIVAGIQQVLGDGVV